MRDPHAFTPMLEEGVGGAPPRSLLLGGDLAMNQREISKFSEKDAKVRPSHQSQLSLSLMLIFSVCLYSAFRLNRDCLHTTFVYSIHKIHLT